MEELDQHMKQIKKSLYDSSDPAQPEQQPILNVGNKRKQLEMLRNIEVQKALQGIKPDDRKKPTAQEQYMLDMKSSLTILNSNLGQQQKFL